MSATASTSTKTKSGSALSPDLRSWSVDDLELLRRANAPELMTLLGGPETDEKVLARHARYLDGWRTGAASMFLIATGEHPDGVGVIGYWPHEWLGEPRLETGWTVLAEYQGRGYATAARRAVFAHAASHSDREWIHAFPRTDNGASKAICQKAEMTLLGEVDFEYPAGNPIVSNDWAYTLTFHQDEPV